MIDIDKDIFHANLKLTQVYCEQQINIETSNTKASILRSFNPIYNGQPLFKYEQYDYKFSTGNKFSCEIVNWQIAPIGQSVLIQNLFDEQLSNKKGAGNQTNNSYEGKILLAEIDNTLTDGASEVESEGLIDCYDLPPVDTWFYLTEGDYYNTKMRYLFAWIPLEFCQLVNYAIDVNCAECIHWFNESDNDEVLTQSFESVNETFSQPNFWNRLKNKFTKKLTLKLLKLYN